MRETQNADEMIRANGAAEAAQTDRLKSEIDEYSRQLEELTALYQKNNVLVDRLQKINLTAADSMRTILQENAERKEEKSETDPAESAREQEALRQALADSVEDSQKRIEELLQQSDQLAHRENVRVYRNVQASMIAELEKQTQQLQAAQDEQTQSLQSLQEEQLQNMQAVQTTVNLLQTRLEQIAQDVEDIDAPSGVGLQVVTLIFVILSTALGVLSFLGINLNWILSLF